MFESAISTNFDAVCFLRSGCFDEALFCSKVSLASVQAAGQKPTEDSMGTSTATIVSVPVHDGSNDKASVDLFNRAFILEGTKSLANTDENASLCAAVGLYNMALAMKAKGGEMFLAKAMGLFQKVFSIVRACAPTPTDSMSSLFLATVLNLIACQSELFGFSAAQPWINVYQDLFQWAAQAPSLEPEEFEVFASNAVLLSSQQFSAAAAAWVFHVYTSSFAHENAKPSNGPCPYYTSL